MSTDEDDDDNDDCDNDDNDDDVDDGFPLDSDSWPWSTNCTLYLMCLVCTVEINNLSERIIHAITQYVTNKLDLIDIAYTIITNLPCTIFHKQDQYH